MGQTRARNFEYQVFGENPLWARAGAGQAWWQRLVSAIATNLQAVQAPSRAAMAYSYAYRAVPVPRE